MSEGDKLNGLGLAFVGLQFVRHEAARERFNRRLLALHDELVGELEKASKRVAMLREREQAWTMARDGLLAMEATGITLPESSTRELLEGLQEE